jgi:hypothetical protein
MGAREVWQMFPSVIYSVTISPRLFFFVSSLPSQRVREMFRFSGSL